MIIGFDIGNTNTLAGIYRDDAIAPDKTFRYHTDKQASAASIFETLRDFIENALAGSDDAINGVVCSSVVPDLTGVVGELARSRFGVNALNVSHECKLSLKIMYTDPSRLGVDRIANAEAACREYQGDCIIADIGTAATLCVILSDGTFDGGLIAPGIGVTMEALARKASNLHKIVLEKPSRLVARDTEDALKSGFFYGWLSMLDGLISRIEKSYGMAFKVIFTGGFAGILSPFMERTVINDPLLTMKGIKYIYDNNRR